MTCSMLGLPTGYEPVLQVYLVLLMLHPSPSPPQHVNKNPPHFMYENKTIAYDFM